MEIWIRSQDKEVLTLCRDLCVGGIYENEIIADAGCSIGIYKTKERALDVLNEIQNTMKNSAFAQKVNGLGERLDFIPNPILIYEMPKD